MMTMMMMEMMCGSRVEGTYDHSQHRPTDKVGLADSARLVSLQITHVVNRVHSELLTAGMTLASSVSDRRKDS